jgi:hypothetical protein
MSLYGCCDFIVVAIPLSTGKREHTCLGWRQCLRRQHLFAVVHRCSPRPYFPGHVSREEPEPLSPHHLHDFVTILAGHAGREAKVGMRLSVCSGLGTRNIVHKNVSIFAAGRKDPNSLWAPCLKQATRVRVSLCSSLTTSTTFIVLSLYCGIPNNPS